MLQFECSPLVILFQSYPVPVPILWVLYQLIIIIIIIIIIINCLTLSISLFFFFRFFFFTSIFKKKKKKIFAQNKYNIYIQIKFCKEIHPIVPKNAILNSFSNSYFWNPPN